MALKRAGGAARWAELIAVGVGRGALTRAVGRGTIVRPLFGTYALQGTPEQVWIAAAFHATQTCVSLCDGLGLPLLRRPQATHVLVPQDRGLSAFDTRPSSRVVLHRSDAAAAMSVENPVAAAIDLASGCLDRYGQLALVDAALHARKLFVGDLREFRHTPAEQRRWLIDHCDHEAQSLMESYARAWLTKAGFAVRAQVVVGGEGHRDLLVEGCVVVELDGYGTHGNPKSFRQDRARDRRAVHDGKITLRYTFADLFGNHKADLVADVEAALRLIRTGV